MTETEAVGKILTHMHDHAGKLRIYRYVHTYGDDKSEDEHKWEIHYVFQPASNDLHVEILYAYSDNLAVCAEKILEQLAARDYENGEAKPINVNDVSVVSNENCGDPSSNPSPYTTAPNTGTYRGNE